MSMVVDFLVHLEESSRRVPASLPVWSNHDDEMIHESKDR
jgi:hypothetical protein